jgi:hypothetical protein
MARNGQRVMVHHYQGCTQCNRYRMRQLCQEVPVRSRQQRAWRPRAISEGARHTVVPFDELTFSAGAAIACGSGTASARCAA